MHEREAAALERIDARWKKFISLYYQLPTTAPLYHSLRACGVGYCDLVCALARRPLARGVLGQLLGRPVTVLPPRRPQPLPTSTRAHAPATSWRDRPVRRLDRSHVMRSKYGAKFYLGATPRDLHGAGVPWRTLVRARQDGWMEVA